MANDYDQYYNRPYPAVVSFDKYINDVRFAHTGYDQRHQRYIITVEVHDIDEGYLFDSDNDRLMNLLVPQQFLVRLNDDYYEPETVEYEQVGHLTLRVLSPTADIRHVVVHVNLRYFENDRAVWTVPQTIREAFNDTGDEDNHKRFQ
ncbi:orf51-like protein [Peridroma alphabaculovirus]|uniref:Orf51-like protein n=1 Tax=Peridroma alphabaculovirus TaxID=1346829 RepID=A0A068LMT7_9ABAC|nr:orf51-like protein [Peridroma alphabaculovirus]AIE47836.1 orf51-like protein [Peridroma alphabaculovirus]